jgi:nucleoside-triphosphatase THEP1
MQTSQIRLPKIWLQAAVLGSLWAASEIILGSFLHNLHVPMRSIFLASIGVLLMTATGKKWTTKGLFWRAGLICALMKSVSPSGVILAPMVAIFFQGILLEISTRLAGKNLIGFILGGILALCWNLFQMIIYQIFIYGYDIVTIYQKLYDIASEAFPIPDKYYWLPIYISLGMHIFFGLVAAISGYFLANNENTNIPELASMKASKVQQLIQSVKNPQSYNINLLLLNIILFVAYFLIVAFIKYPFINFISVLPLAFWMIKYRKTLRILKKPGFWILFIGITMVSAMLIDQVQNTFHGFSTKGLLIGININLRALVLVTGFSVIGFELSNPAIKNRFKKPAFRNLFSAMEAASLTLPRIIAYIPGPKFIFRKPRTVFSFLVTRTAVWLEQLEIQYTEHNNVMILTGPVHSGKTTLLIKIVNELLDKNIPIKGFFCTAVFENSKRIGYDISNPDGSHKQLLSRKTGSSSAQIGDYHMDSEGMNYGFSCLDPASINSGSMVIIDEIGPWEIAGQGWAPALIPLLRRNDIFMIWVVRDSIVDAVIKNWNLTNPKIVYNTKSDLTEMITAIETYSIQIS